MKTLPETSRSWLKLDDMLGPNRPTRKSQLLPQRELGSQNVKAAGGRGLVELSRFAVFFFWGGLRFRLGFSLVPPRYSYAQLLDESPRASRNGRGRKTKALDAD